MRVGAGRLIDGDHGAVGLAVLKRPIGIRVIWRRELDPADVLDADERAVRIGANDGVLRTPLDRETALGLDVELE